MTMTTTKMKTTTKNWTRTIALPLLTPDTFRREVSLCARADGAWFLVDSRTQRIIGQLDRTQPLVISCDGEGLKLALEMPLTDCGYGFPITVLATLRRVFPAWTVEADEATWVRIFELESFIGALRIS